MVLLKIHYNIITSFFFSILSSKQMFCNSFFSLGTIKIQILKTIIERITLVILRKGDQRINVGTELEQHNME